MSCLLLGASSTPRKVKKKVKVAQSCPTLWDPHGVYSPWNSPGQNTGVGSLSLLQGIFPPQELNPGLSYCGWILFSWATGKPKNTGVGSLSLVQWIFPTQGLNWGLLHCRRILYQLSHQEILRSGSLFFYYTGHLQDLI